MKKVFALFLIAVAMLCSGCGADIKTTSQAFVMDCCIGKDTSLTGAKKTAEEANQKYAGKTIQVTGKICSVDIFSDTGEIFVVLLDKGGYYSYSNGAHHGYELLAILKDPSIANSLSKGQIVTATGKYISTTVKPNSGYYNCTVFLDKCELKK